MTEHYPVSPTALYLDCPTLQGAIETLLKENRYHDAIAILLEAEAINRSDFQGLLARAFHNVHKGLV